MRVDSLTIHGVTCFENTFTLDCTALSKGLVAIVGKNGMGKTTFLETVAALMYRKFPSRDDKELFDYATGRDSYLEMQVSLDGRGTYRCRINLDGVKRTSEAVLTQLLPDGTEVPLNDGKVSTYDQEARKIFPDRALFMSSAFVCQDKSGSWGDADKKTRKNIFMKGLGLERLEGLSETAKAAAGLVDTARERLIIIRDRLLVNTTPDVRAAIEEEEARVQTEAARLTALRAGLQTDLTRLDTELTALQEQTAKFHAAVATLEATRPAIELAEHDEARTRQDLTTLGTQYAEDGENLTHRLEILLSDIDALLCDEEPLNRELATIDDDQQTTLTRLTLTAEDQTLLTDDLATIEADLTQHEIEIDQRVKNNEAILLQSDEIRAAVAAKAAAERQTAVLREQEAVLRGQGQTIQSALNTANEHLAELHGLAGQLTHLEKAIETLAGVPCEGSGRFGACRFLIDAKAAQDQVISLRETLSTRTMWEQERDRQVDLQQANQQAFVDLGLQLGVLGQQIAKTEPKAKLLASVETAEARIADLKTQHRRVQQAATAARANAQNRETARLADLARQRELAAADAVKRRTEAEAREQARHADLQARYQRVRRESAAEVTKLTTRYEEQRAALDALLVSLTERLVTLRTDVGLAEQDEHDFAGAAMRATELQGEFLEARERWDESTAAVAKIEAEQFGVVCWRQAFDTRQTELDDVTARAEKLADELIEWNLLTKALSRDGLPTLEIANVGPTVSAYGNQLMAAAYGTRFSMELVTQEPTSDGKALKEVFSLKVWDNERGGEARDMSDLSGGEKVIVAEALANAIALAVNAQNQQPIRTCWRDETTGALHPDTALQYVAMLRKVQELGGFERIYYITHNPDAAALADAQLCFHDGTMDVRLPPYAAQVSA